jgi:sensor histidine kinase regulating citrate/malate metabolism
MENSYPNKKAQTVKEASLNKIFNKSEASLNHGYGLLNVQSTVDKYHGFLVCQEEEFYITDILIPCKAEL